MKDEEEISVHNRFNTANKLPKRVTEMNLLCTIALDLFQCGHPSREPHSILYAAFSTAESNVSPGMLSTVRNMLSCVSTEGMWVTIVIFIASTTQIG
ncbi:hypothetical protein AVEN_101174-1 [Araneus ventricosus]|uniref:Uncharacterized protein n=1 Tax=Araneus ventricosus TaxID=182803 RepID=A0A4Y2DG58_ARAVE|nr:hypothetical protein AVEN_101174-1 [Araneus ventricosus]